MDMFKKTFDRAKQTVEEKFGDATVTAFDPEVQRLIARSDDIKYYTEKILAGIEAMVQPDPSVRLLATGGLNQEEMNKSEVVASEMGHLAGKISDSSYGAALKIGEQAYSKVGASEREFINTANQKYIMLVKRFLQENVRSVANERKTLDTRRLDLDSWKGKAARNAGNAAITADLQKAEKAFEDQQKIVAELIKTKIESHIPELQKNLKALVTSQIEHLQKSETALRDLNKVL